MAGYPMPQSLEQATKWYRTVMDGWGVTGVYFAVCELGDDRFVGTTWLKNLTQLHGNAELAIFMDADHIGSGWGTDTLRVLLTFAFGTLGLERVYLTTTAENNERAIRSYGKVGFTVEGRMRNAYRSAAGGLHDSLLMSILRDEWGAARG